MKNAANKHTAVYETAIAYHGCLEPMNGVAYEKDGIMHIHSGHQSFTFAVGNTAAALGVEQDKIVCHQYYAGGGFGRRTELSSSTKSTTSIILVTNNLVLLNT